MQTPGYLLVNLGVRRRWRVGDRDLALRAVVVNAFSRTGWMGTPSEQLWSIAPRTFRATLTATF
ncbi:MAG TPA: hypothetical protein VGE49_01335 [Brevundimonas sp.]